MFVDRNPADLTGQRELAAGHDALRKAAGKFEREYITGTTWHPPLAGYSGRTRKRIAARLRRAARQLRRANAILGLDS